MKRIIFAIASIALISSQVLAQAQDLLNPIWVPEIEKPEWAPDIEAGMTFETKYVWRGQQMADDFVLQPEAAVSKYGLTLSWWGNFSTASDREVWTEHDYTTDYTFNIGEARDFFGTARDGEEFMDPLGLSFGHVFYIFPEESGKNFHSEEFYLGISYDSFIAPFVNFYMDYARGAGSYMEFGIAPSVELARGIIAAAGVTAAYNAGQWGYGYKFAPMLFSGEINVRTLKYFTITPNVNYSLALDREREDNGLAYGSEFYCGVKVNAAF